MYFTKIFHNFIVLKSARAFKLNNSGLNDFGCFRIPVQ